MNIVMNNPGNSKIKKIDKLKEKNKYIFNYTNEEVNWKIPNSGKYKIVAYGAQGDSAIAGNNGGLGGKVGGVIQIAKDSLLKLEIYKRGEGGGRRGRAGGGTHRANTGTNGGNGSGGTKLKVFNELYLAAGGGGGSGARQSNISSSQHGGAGSANGGSGGTHSLSWVYSGGNGGDGSTVYDGAGGGGSSGWYRSSSTGNIMGRSPGGNGEGGRNFLHGLFNSINESGTNDGDGYIELEVLEIYDKEFPKEKNAANIYSYNNLNKDFLKENINNLKLALFNNKFKFNPNKRYFIELKNEISHPNYPKKGVSLIQNCTIKKDKLNIDIESILIPSLRLKTNYGIIYNSQNDKLLFCIDFGGEITSNNKKELTISFNDSFLSLSKISNIELLNLLDDIDYQNKDYLHFLIKSNYDFIKEKENLLKFLISNKYILNVILDDKWLTDSLILNQDILNYIFKELQTFKNFYNEDLPKFLLDTVIENKKALFYLTNRKMFLDSVLKYSTNIKRNSKKIEILLNAIVDNKDITKKYLDELYKEFQEVIEQKKSLKKRLERKLN